MDTAALASLTVAVSGALWGLWWIPLRQLESHGLAGNWATVTAYGTASLIMLPFALPRLRLPPRSLARLASMGLLSGFSFALWNDALLYGSVVRVTLLFYLAPVWATLFTMIILRERVGPSRLLSILLGFAGAVLVLDFQGLLPLPRNAGEWAALFSGITFALMSVWTRAATDLGAIVKTFANLVFAIPFALAMILVLPSPPLSLEVLVADLPSIALTGLWLVVILLPLVWGMARLDPGRIAVLLLFEVVAAAVSASLLTNEPFGWREACGSVLILGAGVVEGLAQAGQARRVKAAV